MGTNENSYVSTKKIDQLVNQYFLQKTLRFELNPVGKTLENYQNKHLLETDEEINSAYQTVKTIIDRYLKKYNDDILSNIKSLKNLKQYVELYFHSKTQEERVKLADYANKLRKEIASEFDVKNLFGKELIKEKITPFIENNQEREAVKRMFNHTTFFTGFYTSRKNMYNSEAKSVGIAYRCINDNLPKFLDNVQSYKKIKNTLPQETLDKLNSDFKGVYGTTVDDVFSVDYFNFVLSQSGIESYNKLIGGYTDENKQKIKGINEYVNLFNQKAEKSDKIPLLKPLYKQILADKESASFIPAKFDNDNQLLKAVYDLYNTDEVDEQGNKPSIRLTVEKLKNLLSVIEDYSLDGIYISDDSSVTNISQKLFGLWSMIQNLWNNKYDSENKKRKIKDIEKYAIKRSKIYKSIESFSLSELRNLQEFSDDEIIKQISIGDFFKKQIELLNKKISDSYSLVEPLLNEQYDIENKSFKNDESSVTLLKNFLDSLKDFESFVKLLTGTGTESNKDELFYGEFTHLFDRFKAVDTLYDKVRNYVTQKPYSTDKIKLTFGNSQFAEGWDKSKEEDHLSILLTKDENYYLAVIDKDSKKVFENLSFKPTGNDYRKIVYKLLSKPCANLPRIFFPKSDIERFAPDDEILSIYEKGTFKKDKNFNIDDCHKLIDFYKASIDKYPDWKTFDFKFKDTNSYNDISEFYREVEHQGYKISYDLIPSSYIDTLIDEGKIYLFQIYNKDFSEHSKGKPNLHTMYFKMLFDENNLKDICYKLNGGAEMLYRPASIKADKPTHPANIQIDNKNPNNTKKKSIFKYDLIKDKRFTKPQFSLHIPITMNCKCPQKICLNNSVRELLKQCENNYVIGIDRGERNLIYITVIDGKGNIVEQYSLNSIQNEYNGIKCETDYHNLLNSKKENRQKARQNWTTIENIKEIKEGYISQVVHKICQLVEKYDAVIAMEDLNTGFKRSRMKIEKQVYQKFEKMLIDKLNFYVNKDKSPDENGGLMHAYQLTNKFNSFKSIGVQNGIIFYIPAWLTSKIDPVTGFVDLIKPKYKNEQTAREFIEKFDSIHYNTSEKFFEFSFNYDNFERGKTDYRKQWTVCTNGERIRTFRDPKNNNKWTPEEIVIADEFKKLFDSYSINYSDGSDIKKQICNQSGKEFFAQFINLLALTLQMRNSKTNTDIDYLISPVKDKNGNFYCSKDYDDNSALPANADANGAYNIARKALWAIDNIKKSDDVHKARISITNDKWLEYVQKEDMNK